MLKVNRVIKYLLLIVSMFCLVACKGDEVNIEEYNDVFFDHFSSAEDMQTRTISDLKLCYYDTYYYFDVTYFDDSTNKDYELLYILRYGAFMTFFSIKDSEEALTYCTADYTAYLEAIDNGSVKVYSNDEIKRMVNNYYK